MRPDDPRIPWSRLDAATRIDVLRAAQREERVTDPDVAEAAALWAHDSSWSTRINRLPGWLLPATAVLMAAVFAVVSIAVPWAAFFCVPALVAAGLGLVSWNTTAAARALRSVYPRPETASR